MQTFLPYEDFAKSARSLDRKRLGKQRVEAKQIYLALTQPGYGWQKHPAVRMWRGYEKKLLEYGLAICDEWISRGYRDSLRPWFQEQLLSNTQTSVSPPWLGSTYFHKSHQSNLKRKAPEHYDSLFETVGSDLPYVWPV